MMSSKTRTTAPGLHVCELQDFWFYEYYWFWGGNIEVFVNFPFEPLKSVSFFKDYFFSTKRSYGNNCAHWKYNPNMIIGESRSVFPLSVSLGGGGEYSWTEEYQDPTYGLRTDYYDIVVESYGSGWLLYKRANTSSIVNGVEYRRYVFTSIIRMTIYGTDHRRREFWGKWEYFDDEYYSEFEPKPTKPQLLHGPRSISERPLGGSGWSPLWYSLDQSTFKVPPTGVYFHFGENKIWEFGYPIPTESYKPLLKRLEYNSYLDTLDSFETCADNNISNIASALDLMKSLFSGDIIKALNKILSDSKIKKLLSASAKDLAVPFLKLLKDKAPDLWLKYRYAFCTTVSDVKDIVKYANSSQLIKGKKYRVDGYAKETYLGTEYAMHCMYYVTLADQDPTQQVLNKLYELSLQPNAYILWDMLPFSFVIDWFVHVGDYLGDKAKANYVNTEYAISDFSYTLEYTAENPVGNPTLRVCRGQVYSRYYSQPPAIEYGLVHHSGSRKTCLKRTNDAVALATSIIGG